MLQQRYERAIEEKWQKRWEESGTYRFDDKDSARPLYTIDTPPPFTSGELHMGHVLSYSYIDFTARYKRMAGFNVYYPQGWDTQGFPTEVRVEKKFGRLPPVEFRQKCIEWTLDMIARMKAQMTEMGFSPDWRYEYKTMESDYHRKVQLSLIRMYGDRLVYRGKYPVYWCPSCGSAVAKAELDDEEKAGTLNYIYFSGPEGEKLPIATSRPELMTACVAVLFNPEDVRYKNLEGKTVTTALGKQVPVFSDRDVEKEFGTGLLMVCTFGDKMDVVWMHRYKLPLIEAIDRHGRMQDSGEFNGLKVAEARKKVVEKLEAEGRLFKKEALNQTVKVHDRCKTPVELTPSLQWFADIRTTAKRIKALAEKVRWVPDFGISYLIDWVEGAEWDWVISRQRIFGTPLPFYGCECGTTAAAGEDELPFYPEKAKEKICTCGKRMTAETSTCDCWVDSSITPLIIAGWPDEKKMERFYPASLRPQGVEIVRTWAFYTIYRSGVALTGKQPWETILLNGNVLSPDGKKMSKSLGNIISPAELLRDYPTDAIRQWAALSGAMAKDRPFSYEDIKHAKSFLAKVWNAARFTENVLKEEIGGEAKEEPELSVIDKWITGRLNTTIKQCTEHMEKFEFHYAMSKLQAFFWGDFCDNYLEYVKHRVYENPGAGNDGKAAAVYTLRKVLDNSLLLLAPFAPHMAEELNYELFGRKESIHRAKWPGAGPEYAEEVAEVTVLNSVISELRQHKAKNRLAQNAELARVRLSLPEPMSTELLSELQKISKITEIEAIKGEFSVSVL